MNPDAPADVSINREDLTDPSDTTPLPIGNRAWRRKRIKQIARNNHLPFQLIAKAYARKKQ